MKQSILFNMIWQMIKPFIREKLKSRIFFHGNKMSSFHNHIPPAYLPENYGGELPKIDYSSAEWYPVMLKHEDRIKRASFFFFFTMFITLFLWKFCRWWWIIYGNFVFRVEHVRISTRRAMTISRNFKIYWKSSLRPMLYKIF